MKWWGRTILPDGTVHEVSKADAKALFERSKSREGATTKITLPKAVPGCVIDYGYTLDWAGLRAKQGVIPIQAKWPIRSYRFRFVPARAAEPRLMHADDLNIGVTSKRGVILVIGTDLPPRTGAYGAGLVY